MTPDELQSYAEIATSVIGVCSIIAAITPNPVDNAVLVAIKKAINLAAINVGCAENKYKPGEKMTRVAKKPNGKYD